MARSMTRPTIGGVVGLVYRECPCGDWCATGEGAHAPLCADCGGAYMPAGVGDPDVGPQFYETFEECRRERSLGFVALFTNEIQGFALVGKIHRLLGLTSARMNHDQGPPRGPYYTEHERQSASDRATGAKR